MSATGSQVSGTVLNIQRYCSHDGPGIRTTVFLKGCSLRCKWCSNPESIHPKPELAYDARLCSGAKECGLCLKAPFPEGAFFTVPGPDDKVRVNWDLASECDEETVSLCPTKALYMFGATMTADEVLDEVEKDASFYRSSGGGMTLSGAPDQSTLAAIRAALADHLVLVIEDQHLTPAALRDFVAHFGPLFHHHADEGVIRAEGVPEVLEMRKEPNGERLFGGSDWHADVTFRKPAGYLSVLHALVVPPLGGDTDRTGGRGNQPRPGHLAHARTGGISPPGC